MPQRPGRVALEGLSSSSRAVDVVAQGRRGQLGISAGFLADLLQLIDVGENAGELMRERGKLLVGDAKPRERRHVAHDLRTDRRRLGGHPDNCKASRFTFRIGTSLLARTPKKLAGRRLLAAGSAGVAALARRAELRALQAFASRLGETVWIVGGAARDLLLGRQVPEVDAAVSGNVQRVAAAMEDAGFGRAVAISRRPPRVFRIAGRREVDLAELEGLSIEEDLTRRDFTVNAMAFDLAHRRWLDPFGGREDLAAGRLRLVSRRNLEEDPLRVLRAARFIATHGLQPDAATSRACRLAASGLAGVAPERIRAEWIKLLESPRAGPAIAWAGRAGALEPALRLDSGRTGRLARASHRLDAPAIRRLPPDRRRRLRLALVCAAAGISSAEAAAWLAARRYGRSESGQVAALLRLASDARRASGVRPPWAWVRDAGDLAPDALTLLVLLSPEAAPRARGLRRRLRKARRKGPRVSGGDILAWLGLPPGPEVGRLLAELEVEILRGTVRSRREVRTWLSVQGQRGAEPAIIRFP